MAQPVAHAQPLGNGFDLERFAPTPAGDRFDYVFEPLIRDERCTAISCMGALTSRLVIASDPLTLVLPAPQGNTSVSASTVRLHWGAEFSVFRFLQFSVDVPVILYQGDLSILPDGFQTPAGGTRVGASPSAFDIGDVRFGARVACNPHDDLWSFGVQLLGAVPTGDHERLAGDPSARFESLAMVEFGKRLRTPVVITADAGLELRGTVTLANDAVIGSGFEGGLAAAISLPHHPQYELVIEGRVDGLTPWHALSHANTGGMFSLGPRILFDDDRMWLQAEMGGGYGGPGVSESTGTISFTFEPWIPPAPTK
ncbi:MAG TPA: hypothetical protein VH142_15445 [Polyangiaceae bacterium]|nr:hypothetical protein [Polyangiaceae bacterium]